MGSRSCANKVCALKLGTNRDRALREEIQERVRASREDCSETHRAPRRGAKDERPELGLRSCQNTPGRAPRETNRETEREMKDT